MRDQDISYFIEKFGEATSYSAVPEKSMTKWKGILPDKLLSYWKTEEWGTYKNGLFSLVNPDKDEVVLDIWLEDTPFKEMDAYHVIVRSAFGELYVFGESTGRNITIQPLFNQIIFVENGFMVKTIDELNSEIESFLAFSNVEEFDLFDCNDNYIFDRAVKQPGVLADNEMFGLEPAYILGGQIKIENLSKVDCQIHLMILRELSPSNIIGF
ncbi:DUF1851 domain-containing protein [Salmonella enterica subsp. enterica]|nr:GAD-like domain protein [Salmonella enterica subsp. enterica]EDQ9967485.1 DUF1851 domain-containing protein [Salmonella enterica subsp. enterica serovar Java]ECD2887154.1 DUF1851 domain-containing protein [Salmonella enterica subsp. enterica]ECD4084175.1 DUF1851 domain-containing protein [Salmonella enterica subsp. enterica]ECD6590185.1 DUF1851 domain-containing protein [Salmonella enterica subsp. enterica]